MQRDEVEPTLTQGMLRLGTLFAVIAVGGHFFWNFFSETAALNRLEATAKSYRYTQSCDAEGHPVSSGVGNCVDLNHYVFVYGPTMKALRRACTGKSETILFFEKGKVARTEINSVEKLLRFREQYGTNSPCGLYR